MKCYRIDVEMINGFKYSYTCISRMKEGMKQASSGYWTKSVTETEITEEEHRAFYDTPWEKEPKIDKALRKAVVKSSKVVDSGKLVTKSESGERSERKGLKKTPKLSSLEDFFSSDEEPVQEKKI